MTHCLIESCLPIAALGEETKHRLRNGDAQALLNYDAPWNPLFPTER